MNWDDDAHEADDDGPEDYFASAPLPREDRLWRHPAEVAAEARLTSTTTVRTPWRKTLAVAGASAVLSAGIVATLFLSLGTRSQPADLAVADQTVAVVRTNEPLFPVAQPVPAEDWPTLIGEEARASIARIIVDVGGRRKIGSGFLFRPDGQLLTSYDLVGRVAEVEVKFRGLAPMRGKVIGSDQRSGIGVVQVPAGELPPVVQLALLKQPPIVGNYTVVLDAAREPASIPITHVSAVETEIEIADAPNLYGLIQLDAPLPPAATGAPVLDDTGKAIGVAVARGPEGGTAVVPIGYARAVAEDMDRYAGQVKHTWLGITGRDITIADGAARSLEGGVEVVNVIENSPAAAIGLEVGDILTAFHDRELLRFSDLKLELREHPVGSVVEIVYLRGADSRTQMVTLAARD